MSSPYTVGKCEEESGKMSQAKEIHLTRRDFHLEWFSGSGGGGQHRNKHDNCCRITHIETGIRAQCTAHRDRVSNKRDAFYVLAARLLDHYNGDQGRGRARHGERVRSYNEARNDVIDHGSGKRDTYKRVVVDANIGELIEARRSAMLSEREASA